MYEMKIGLETHVELSTKSKIFCSCANSFGKEPNSLCCPVCMGLPGTLPVLNRQAVRYGVMAGIALNCEVYENSVMVRKNYIYPDLPKAYQITQGDFPLCKNGFVMLSGDKKIRINRLHIEEDAGKLIHGEGMTFADYNRCGVPLVEIVTEPDFTTAEQVREYVETLRLTMRTLEISDCRMQEGSLRCDVNISVSKPGEKSENRTEIKNINSVSFMVKAINYEFSRQCRILEEGGEIARETRGFDEKTGETYLMRAKETAADYRYFPEPDIPTVHISAQEIEDIKKNLPELPKAKTERFMKDYSLSEKDAELLVKYPKTADYFEKLALKSGNKKTAAKIMLSYMLAIVKNEKSREEAEFPEVKYVAEVVSLVSEGRLQAGFVMRVLEKIVAENKPFSELFDIADFSGLSEQETAELCRRAICENEAAVQDYLSGKEKAIFALVGKVMKESKGRADPEKVKEKIINFIKNS